MTFFSANLGLLFTDYDLPDAVRQAHQAGFDAVEFHWPYETSVTALKQALDETALPAIGLNSRKGQTMGLCAITDEREAATDSIDEAFAYGAEIGASAVHVMAGIAHGEAAEDCFIRHLHHACDIAERQQMMVLIEALNPIDVPGYLLCDTAKVAAIIKAVERPSLRMMFDCYHVAKSGGDIIAEFNRHLPYIGHIQFASAPDRTAPDERFDAVFSHFKKAGWHKPLGAEYHPDKSADDDFAWLSRFG